MIVTAGAQMNARLFSSAAPIVLRVQHRETMRRIAVSDGNRGFQRRTRRPTLRTCKCNLAGERVNPAAWVQTTFRRNVATVHALMAPWSALWRMKSESLVWWDWHSAASSWPVSVSMRSRG